MLIACTEAAEHKVGRVHARFQEIYSQPDRFLAEEF